MAPLLSGSARFGRAILSAALGDHCEIHPGEGRAPVLAEVIGFSDDLAYLVPYDNLDEIFAIAPIHSCM